jgi:hypothetical protein
MRVGTSASQARGLSAAVGIRAQAARFCCGYDYQQSRRGDLARRHRDAAEQ